MPPLEFAALAHRGDRELVADFGVPLEQVARRREDLGVGAAARRGRASAAAAPARVSVGRRGGARY